VGVASSGTASPMPAYPLPVTPEVRGAGSPCFSVAEPAYWPTPAAGPGMFNQGAPSFTTTAGGWEHPMAALPHPRLVRQDLGAPPAPGVWAGQGRMEWRWAVWVLLTPAAWCRCHVRLPGCRAACSCCRHHQQQRSACQRALPRPW
jgi:hypothetical protein